MVEFHNVAAEVEGDHETTVRFVNPDMPGWVTLVQAALDDEKTGLRWVRHRRRLEGLGVASDVLAIHLCSDKTAVWQVELQSGVHAETWSFADGDEVEPRCFAQRGTCLGNFGSILPGADSSCYR